MNKHRLILCGAGPWAENIAATIARRSDSVITAQLVKRTGIARNRSVDAPLYHDVADLLASQDFDGAIVCTAPEAHASLCAAFIRRGLPCFVEKPVAMEASTIADLHALALKHSIPVTVDYIHLFSDPFLEMAQQVRQRGYPRKLVGVAGNSRATAARRPILWDWGPHDFAMALTCLGLEAWASDQTWESEKASKQDDVRIEGHVGRTHTLFHFSNAFRRKTRTFIAAYEDEVFVYDGASRPSTTQWHRQSRNERTGFKKVGYSEARTLPLDVSVGAFINSIERRQSTKTGLELTLAVTDALVYCSRQLSASGT